MNTSGPVYVGKMRQISETDEGLQPEGLIEHCTTDLIVVMGFIPIHDLPSGE